MTQAEKGVLIAEIKVVEFWMDFKMTIVNKINSLFIKLSIWMWSLAIKWLA